MKRLSYLLLIFCLALLSTQLQAQEMVNPVIKNYGGIRNAPHAEEKPDPDMEYKVVIDVATGEKNKKRVSNALNNVARLINLHVMGGLPKEKLNIVLAIHGGATFTTLSNELYNEKFGVDNPNLELIKELEAAGVKLFVCSQSLMGRKIDHEKILPEVKVATAMLTVMTTYQMKGHAYLKF